MYLKAKNQHHYVEVLGETINKPLKNMSFEERVDFVKRLAFIDTNKFFKIGSEDVCPTFRGRRFKLKKPIEVSSHSVDTITSFEDYDTILCHGIEKVVRSFFSNNEIRSIISLIIEGDDVLKSSIYKARHYREFWYHNSTDEDLNKEVNLLPVFIEDTIGTIEVAGELPFVYTCSLLSLALFSHFVFCKFDEIVFPIGKYNVISTQDDNYLIPEEVHNEELDGFIPFKIIVKKESFKTFADQTFSEIIFNATKGVIYHLDLDKLNMIEEKVLNSIANRKALRKMMALLLSAKFPMECTEIVISVLNKIFDSLETDINETILDGRLSGLIKTSSKIFFYLLPSMKDSTLFEIANKPNLICIVDEFGFKKDNITSYIVSEQISRYKDRDELDVSIRDTLEKLDFDEMEKLLYLIFKDVETTEEELEDEFDFD